MALDCCVGDCRPEREENLCARKDKTNRVVVAAAAAYIYLIVLPQSGRVNGCALATIIMKHKKEKKEKSKKKGRTSLLTMQRHHQQQQQHHHGTASSAALLDQAALQSAYRWEKLSPAEFEQLQDLAACKLHLLSIAR